MAYVESFARAMERARQSVSYWDRKTLDHLQAAHDAEMRQCSKTEFHRGYESGVAVRDAEQWQLDRKRHKVVCRLHGFEAYNGGKPSEEASKLIRCIIGREDCHVACVNDLEEARDRLIYLLGGKSTNKGAETSAKVVQNGEKYQLANYDVLGNERHKAVCELRKLNSENFECKQFMGDLLSAIDPDWISKASMYDEATLNEYMRDRLIHLLGDDDGPITDAVQPSSITDELREYAMMREYGTPRISPNQCVLESIADRIDEQFERICSQHESVLQQTIDETVDEHECEMDELRANYEQAISDITGVDRGEGSDLLMPVDVFLHVRDGLRHDVEMWRDRAEDMRKERDDLRADYERATKLQREYGEKVVDLQDKLQAISVLCEQDDG